MDKKTKNKKKSQISKSRSTAIRSIMNQQTLEDSDKESQSFDVYTQLEMMGTKLPVISGYKIISLCGKGGMGTVYKAWDLQIKRDVAIKVIPKNTLGNEYTQRFTREYQINSQLVHPHIVRLFQVGSTDDFLFFVMQFIEGENLLRYVEDNKCSYRKLVRLFLSITDAMKYAHENKIIHRDLKPANIMVDRSGNPFIMDFGLAKTNDGDYELTKTGQIMGTPHYMSPEQALGESKLVDSSSDVFSLGVILYQLLTKTLPFDGAAHIELYHKIVYIDPIPIRKIAKNIPRDLNFICSKALAKSIKNRYVSAAEMHQDLLRFSEGKKISASRWNIISQNQKKKLLYLSLFLVMLFITLYYYIAPRQENINIADLQISTTISLEQKKKYVQNLISYSIYEEALKYTKEILEQETVEEEKNKWIQKEIHLLVKTKKYKQAIDLFQQIAKEHDEDTYLAIARAYMEQKNLDKALSYLEKISAQSKNDEYLYLYGKVLLKQNLPAKAIPYFEKLALSPSATALEINVSKFNEAQSYFLWDFQKYSEKIIYLLENIISSMPEEVLIYEYLGRTYTYKAYISKDNNATNFLAKAKEYLLKCIEIAPNQSDYYVYLAEIETKLNLQESAFENLVISLDKEADNQKALLGMLKLTLYDTTRLYECFQFLKYYVERAFDEKHILPNLFTSQIENVLDTYEESYRNLLAWKKQQTAQQVDVSQYFRILEKSIEDQNLYDSCFRGLQSIRHHENWENFFQKALQKYKISSLQYKRLENIKSIIDTQKKQEQNYALYFLMAHLYLYEKTYTKQELEPYLDGIESILIDSKEDILLRYLAGNTLTKLFEYEKLEFWKNQKDYTLSSICAITLQQSHFPIDEKICIQIARNHQDIFLRSLAIQSLYENVSISNESLFFLKSLLKNENDILRIYAAAGIWSVDKSSVESEKILKVCMSAIQENHYRYFGNYYFWQNHAFSEYTTKFSTEFFNSVEDPDDKIRALLVYYLGLSNEKDAIPYLEKIIKQNPNSIPALKASSEIVHIVPDLNLTLEFFRDKNVSPFIQLTQSNTLLKVYCYIEYARSITTAYISNHITSPNKDYMRELDKMRELLTEMGKPIHLIPAGKDLYFKMMAYFICTTFKYQALVNLPLESDENIKSHIFINWCSATIDQKIPEDIPEKFRLIIESSWKFFTNRYSFLSNEEVKKVIDSHTKSKNIHLKRNASIAKIVFSSPEKQQNIFEKMSNADKITKKAIAYGFHAIVRIKTINSTILGDRSLRVSIEHHYWIYLNTLRRLVEDSDVWQYYKSCISKAISFDNSKAIYYFERGFLYSTRNMWQEAVADWEEAVAKEPNNIIYRYSLADAYNKINVNKNLEIITLKAVPYSKITLKKLGDYYFARKEYNKAKKVFKQLFTFDDFDVADQITLLRIYVLEKDLGYAAKYLDYLLKKYPQNDCFKSKNLLQYTEFQNVGFIK